MIVKLLIEHHLEFLSLKGGCRGSSESTLVKMSIVGNLMLRLKYKSLNQLTVICTTRVKRPKIIISCQKECEEQRNLSPPAE